MFGSYFTSAFRAIQRDPLHALVNVLGLAIALAASLLIALYARHELTYENFFTDPDRIYRIDADITLSGQSPTRWVVTPYPIPDLLNIDFEGQLVATRAYNRGAVITIDGVRTRQTIYVADDKFFQVTDLPMLAGDPHAAMAEPGAVLLTETMAKRLFGDEPAMGQTIRVDNTYDLHVAGIMKDIPRNSQFDFQMLASMATPQFQFPPMMSTNWNNVVQISLVRLLGATEEETIARQLPGFVARNKPPAAAGMTYVLYLQPLRTANFTGPDSLRSTGPLVTLIGLIATAVFLIFIACFSYINLATARSLLRVKEVGLRKILGGETGEVALQFFLEAVLVTAAGFVLALLVTAAILPVFATLVDRPLELVDLLAPEYIASIVGLLAFVSVAAGAYPAFVLASRKPIELFHMKRSARTGGFLRTGIVTVQFALTAALMIVATIVFAQITYMRNIDLGFDETGLMTIPVFQEMRANGGDQAYREELARSPAIENLTVSNATPTEGYEFYRPLARAGEEAAATQSVLQIIVADTNFFDVYGLTPLAGRMFSDEYGEDQARQPTPEQPVVRTSIILSESAVDYFRLGSPAAAIGQELSYTPGAGAAAAPDAPQLRVDYVVVGVVPDFHFRLARQELGPMAFFYDTRAVGQITARVRDDSTQAAVEDARRISTEMFPDTPFDYVFLEDRIADANRDDDRQSQLFAFFAGLALFVSCLGLFALSSFVVAQRTHEIAVRKVLGGSTSGVAQLLMWDFAKPVLIANILAWPLAWIAVRPWLDQFPYRIEPSPVFFIGVSIVALAVALVTVFARTFRAAETRPAIVLRNE